MLGHLGLGPVLPLRLGSSEQVSSQVTRDSGYKMRRRAPRSPCPSAWEGH